MHIKDLLIDDSGYWKAVETIRERLPELDVMSTFACAKSTSVEMPRLNDVP